MDVLKQVALPQSTEHFQLLLMILNLIYVVFLPYFGFVLGSAVLSIAEYRTSQRTGSSEAFTLAREAVDITLNDWRLMAFLGVIPALSLVFIYAQLLQSTAAISVGLMGWGVITLCAGFVLLYMYRLVFKLAPVPTLADRIAAREGAVSPELSELTRYSRAKLAGQRRLGLLAVLLLFASSVLCVGAMVVAANADNWAGLPDVFGLLLSLEFWVKYAQFLAVAFGTTGVGLLFFEHGFEGTISRPEGAYQARYRSVGRNLAITSLLAQPALIVLGLLVLPARSLSGGVFGLSGASLLMFFLAVQFVYAYHRRPGRNYSAYAFYALGVALLLLFTADQMAIGNATRGHSARLAHLYERDTELLKSRLGVAAPAMTGEDIYNGKCSACHLFDQRKVGPPYGAVVPKYAGDKAKLIAFVLNPVKVDPAYPPMPNQGLKPAEADSVVTYLLGKTGGARPVQATVPSPPAK